MSGSAGGARTYSLNPVDGGVSVPRLLFALLRQRFTGTVTVSQREPEGERTIWVRGGMPVFCDWVSTEDRLGDMLVMSGLLDMAGLERALMAAAKSGKLLGQVLVELELLDERGRTRALREQCGRKVVHLFANDATTGEATVTATAHSKGDGDELAQVNVLGLIRAGVDAHASNSQIQAEMGKSLSSDVVASAAFARYENQFGFGPEDAQVLSLLSRGTSMRGLMAPGIDRARALRTTYTLWVTQMLRVGEDAVQAIAKGSTAASAARTEVAKSAPSPKPKAAPAPAPKPEPKPPVVEAAPEPAPAEAAEPAGEFEQGLAELEAKVAAEANAFELFGLDLDAGRKEVRGVWAELSKTYHPDALEGSGRAGLRDRVEAVFAALSEAYGVLSNKEEREKLRSALELGGSVKAGEDTSAVVRNAFEAEMIARDADKLLRARQYARAAELFTKAHELSPQDSDIEAALYYASFRNGAGDRQQAELAITQFDKVIEVAPACARAHYFKGLIALGIEEMMQAKTSFAEALKLDPRNVDAERQLRAIRLRERGPTQPQAKKDDKKSGFGGLRGLFKKD